MDGVAHLPGANPEEHSLYVPTEQKDKFFKQPMRSGCHPTRWIFELLNNNFTECNVFERAEQSGQYPSFVWQHPHNLVRCGNQSYSQEENGERLISTVCLDCRFHIVFRFNWSTSSACQNCGGPERWPLPDNLSPWHHLVWAGGASPEELANWEEKYNPVLASEKFICVAPSCTFELNLEISKPRLPQEHLDKIQDGEAILKALEAAKSADPVRHQALGEEQATLGPATLNTYIKNVLEGTPGEGRKISKGNKKFAIIFGPRCYPLFRYLGFEDVVLMENGVDNGTFGPKTPKPANGPINNNPAGPRKATQLGTERAFLEDIRSELQCVIHQSAHQDLGESPKWASQDVYDALGCKSVPDWGAPGATEDPAPYVKLGVLPGQSKEVVVNAYRRQWEAVPGFRLDLIASLKAVASHLGDPELATYAVMQESLGEQQKPQPKSTQESAEQAMLNSAYLFFGLDPWKKGTASAVLEAYRNTVATDPRTGNDAKQHLTTIAQGSKDESMQMSLIVEASSTSVETARRVLMMEPYQNSAKDVMLSASQWFKRNPAFSDDMNAKQTYVGALRAMLPAFDNDMDLVEFVQNEAKKTGVDDVVMQPNAGPEVPVDWNLPVGLDNIGNTCYLNSLLQYLYTVRVVRDIVTNYDEWRMDLDDESINNRRLGGNKMQMDRGEAVVAQAFVKELGALFENLYSSDKSATRPSQRLANAVLLSTHSLLEPPKKEEPKEVPPPLPERSYDVPMQSVEGEGTESKPWEVISNDSTATLIGDEVNTKVGGDEPGTTVSTADVPARLDRDSAYGSLNEAKGNLKSKDGVDATMTGTGGKESDDAQVTPTKEDPSDADKIDVEPAATTPEPETVDERVLKALEHQKRSSGTDQQDVEEVIGSILNRLQAAIAPIAPDASGIQIDKIMETFYVTTVNYTKKVGGAYQSEISYDRSITAFPAPDGVCSLYDAMGRNFDQEIMEESKLSRYTAIKTLPPIVHVLIQRSQSIGQKNGNAVEIPETLYLDRFMDAEQDGEAFRKRVEGWSVAKRLAELKEMWGRIDENVNTGAMLDSIRARLSAGPQSDPEVSESKVFEAEDWDFDGEVEEDFVMIRGKKQANVDPGDAPSVLAPLPVDEMRKTETHIRKLILEEIAEQEKRLEELYSQLNKTPYRLHAVICHRGQMGSGHYWVWIHDFEVGVWRKYNDATVEERKDTEGVLRELSTTGEPYYLCYVRDGDKEEHVGVVRRRGPVEGEEEGKVEVMGGGMDGVIEGSGDGGEKWEEVKGEGEGEMIEVRVSPPREGSPGVRVIEERDVEMG